MSSTKKARSSGKLPETYPLLATAAELEQVLGIRLAAARRNKGMSQHELALHLGTHQVTLATHETGGVLPRRPMLDRIVTLLDVPLFEFLRAPDPWELGN